MSQDVSIRTLSPCLYIHKKQFSDCNLAHYCCLDNQLSKRTIVDDIVKKITCNYVPEWKTASCRVERVSSRGRNKLRNLRKSLMWNSTAV